MKDIFKWNEAALLDSCHHVVPPSVRLFPASFTPTSVSFPSSSRGFPVVGVLGCRIICTLIIVLPLLPLLPSLSSHHSSSLLTIPLVVGLYPLSLGYALCHWAMPFIVVAWLWPSSCWALLLVVGSSFVIRSSLVVSSSFVFGSSLAMVSRRVVVHCWLELTSWSSRFMGHPSPVPPSCEHKPPTCLWKGEGLGLDPRLWGNCGGVYEAHIPQWRGGACSWVDRRHWRQWERGQGQRGGWEESKINQRDVVRWDLRVCLLLFVFRVDDLKYHEHIMNKSRTAQISII